MFNMPKNKNEARCYRYNEWSGNPKGTKYNPKYCAYEVSSGMLFHQCQRAPGYGPDELFCKQHSKKIIERMGRTNGN